ncbi:LAO/AO transport system ATPase [Actinomyces denticolens]|nr:LAO/AO transport system ATPase [Actinomyces denticolens]
MSRLSRSSWTRVWMRGAAAVRISCSRWVSSAKEGADTRGGPPGRVGGVRVDVAQVWHEAVAEVIRPQAPHVLGVDRLALLGVEARGVGVDVVDVEVLDELGGGEDVLILAQGPSEQREVVEQALGDHPAIAVDEEIGLGSRLESFLLPSPMT